MQEDYKVEMLPTFLFYEDNERQNKLEGADDEALERYIERLR